MTSLGAAIRNCGSWLPAMGVGPVSPERPRATTGIVDRVTGLLAIPPVRHTGHGLQILQHIDICEHAGIIDRDTDDARGVGGQDPPGPLVALQGK